MVQIEHLRDLKKVSNLWSVHFGEVLLRDYLGIRLGQNFLSVLERCPLLDDVRFREVPLYSQSWIPGSLMFFNETLSVS